MTRCGVQSMLETWPRGLARARRRVHGVYEAIRSSESIELSERSDATCAEESGKLRAPKEMPDRR